MTICVIGSLNLDVICRVDRMPRPGETVFGLGVDRLPGGKGANQATAAARCGGVVRFVGAVGADEAGQTMVDSLRSAGVCVDHVALLAGQATGQAFIWVAATGENSIVVASGANAGLTADHVRQASPGECAVVLAQLETPIDAIEAAFVAAPGAIRILNAAPAIAAGRRLFADVEVLIVNETELALYTGIPVPDTEAETIVAARKLISRPDQIVVVTLGAAGAMKVTQDQAARVAGRPAAVVDTTGAGDCFCGALAARLADGAGIDEAISWANVAAALSTERPGAAPAMPTLAEVKARLG